MKEEPNKGKDRILAYYQVNGSTKICMFLNTVIKFHFYSFRVLGVSVLMKMKKLGLCTL